MNADLARAETFFRRDDYLRAYDVAHNAMGVGNDTLRMRYLEVLSAARLGHLIAALRLYEAR